MSTYKKCDKCKIKFKLSYPKVELSTGIICENCLLPYCLKCTTMCEECGCRLCVYCLSEPEEGKEKEKEKNCIVCNQID